MDGTTLQDRSTAEIEDTLCQLLAVRCLIDRQALHCVSALIGRQVWKHDGATGMAPWLSMRAGLSRRTSAEFVRVAGVLDSLPALDQAFTEGSISFEQLAPATRLAETAPEDDFMARHARDCSPESLERSARRRSLVTAEDEEATLHDRSLRMRWDRDRRRLKYWGHLPGADGALFERAIERGVSRRRPEREVNGDDQPPEEAASRAPYLVDCANALVEMASVSLGSGGDADRATLVVSVSADELRDGGNGEIHGGVVIGRRTLERLACDCRVQLVAKEADGRPVGVGRTTRVVDPWLRRVVLDRDKCCIFPFCGRTKWLIPHHLLPWWEGGPTDEPNLGGVCFEHHRLVHEGGWRARRRASGDGYWWIRPDGTVLIPRPVRLRDEVRELFAGTGPPDTS